jgi:hypothetical protein
MEFEFEADPLDVASRLEAAEREACVAAARNRPSMPAVCACYNCGEPLRPGLLFCDADCRDDYEKRQKKDAPRWT